MLISSIHIIVQTKSFTDPVQNWDNIVGNIFRQSNSLSVFALIHSRAANIFQNVIPSGIILCDDRDPLGKMKMPNL